MQNLKNSGIAWVGQIPKHWNVVKGKYCLQYIQKPIRESDEVITCFRDGEVTLRKNRREDGFTVSLKEIGYQGIDVGDLIVHGMDGFAGAIGISDSRGKASPVLNVLETGQNKRYVMYYLRNMAYNGVFEALSTGIRVRSCDTNWGKLRELLYILPPKQEQDNIVAYVDKRCNDIDALIAELKSQISTLEEYKHRTIINLVTKGLNSSVSTQNSGIEWVGNIPSHWKIRPLYCFFGERKNKNKLGKEQNLLSLSYGKIIKKDINSSGGLLPANFNTYNIIEAGDIIIRPTDLQNDKRSLRTGLSWEHGIITSAYIALKPITDVNTAYMHYLLHAYDVMKVFYNMGNGVRQGLNFDEFKRLIVFAPPKDEQDDIVAYLNGRCSEIEDVIAEKKEQLEILANYKKSIIFEYVTGKKEVPLHEG